MSDQITIHDGDADPNVRIPRHVIEQGKQADAIHQQAYADPNAPPAVDPYATPQDPPPPPPTAAQAPLQPPLPPTKDGTKETNPNHETWQHAFLSMQGRYNGLTKQNGELLQINTDLAN